MFKSLSLQKNKLMMLALAMVLTLAMVILPGLNNVAHAATPVDVTVSFLDDGVQFDVDSVDIAVTVDDTEIPTPPAIPSSYPNLGTPTAFDATILAYTAYNGSLSDFTYGYDTAPAYGDPGYYITTILGLGTEELSSSYSSTPGQSYWEGYSWVLSINGVESSVYASNIVLQDDDEIVWNRAYQYITW